MSEEESEFLNGAGSGAASGAGSGAATGKSGQARRGAGKAARKGNTIVTLPPSRVREFSKALASLPDEVYLTVDMDAFDPSFVPSVGTPEPGGLSWQEVNGLMKELAARKTVVGMDVNELRPIPGLVAPDFLAARLVYRLIGRFLKPGR